MLLSPQPATLPPSSPCRKRTSFSAATLTPNPRPAKAPRLSMGLRRTESCLSLPDLNRNSSSSSSSSKDDSTLSTVPYTSTLKYYKEQRERRKTQTRRHFQSSEPLTIRTHLEVTLTDPSPPPRPKPAQQPPQQPQQYPAVHTAHRTSSPLAPMRHVLPARPVFPRSKPEPDLYKKAITARMSSSPTGQKILHMGPRLALSIMNATQELERLVAANAERERELDVVMGDSSAPTSSAPQLSSSWVVVHGEDWEMVDCGA